jgi:hypothetical protein
MIPPVPSIAKLKMRFKSDQIASEGEQLLLSRTAFPNSLADLIIGMRKGKILKSARMRN